MHPPDTFAAHFDNIPAGKRNPNPDDGVKYFFYRKIAPIPTPSMSGIFPCSCVLSLLLFVSQMHNALSPQHSTTVAPKVPSLCCPAKAVTPHSSSSQPTLPITTAPALSVHKRTEFFSAALPHEVWLQILHLADSKRMSPMSTEIWCSFSSGKEEDKGKDKERVRNTANNALISCWVLLNHNISKGLWISIEYRSQLNRGMRLWHA